MEPLEFRRSCAESLQDTWLHTMHDYSFGIYVFIMLNLKIHPSHPKGALLDANLLPVEVTLSRSSYKMTFFTVYHKVLF